MKSLSIFIPRVLSNVTKVDIVNTFKEMNIGEVTYIDLKKRINDNKFSYSIVFLKIELMDTITASALCDLIEQNGSTKLYYDETDKNYWELKNYIPLEQRVKVTKEEEEEEEEEKEEEEEVEEDIPELCKQLMKIPSIFTDKVIEMMNKEYEEIEREIERMREFEIYTTSLPYTKLYTLF
jgi:CO dehydrogenase/acetyl-CoA synthase beta subunit